MWTCETTSLSFDDVIISYQCLSCLCCQSYQWPAGNRSCQAGTCQLHVLLPPPYNDSLTIGTAHVEQIRTMQDRIVADWQ